MRVTRIGLGAVAALVGLPAGARAQTAATVREIVRVVKTGKSNGTDLSSAKLDQALGAGDRVRTAGRSAAGLRFPDRSLLRLGELTEVVVTSASQRNAQVVRGQVWANYRQPGTITGGYAVAAVRGTKIHYLVDEGNKTATVRCYEGHVFVGAADNPVAAGTAERVTGTTLVDSLLQQSTVDWRGGEVRFIEGPYSGQSRPITGFDAATGTVTFAPGLPAPGAGAGEPTGYLLVKQPGRGVVELRRNEGTTVRQGADPAPAAGVPHEEFAMLREQPFFRTMYDGQVLYTYPDTIDHEETRKEEFPIRQAIEEATERNIPRVCRFPVTPRGLLGPRAAGLGVKNALGAEFAQATGKPEGIEFARATGSAGGVELAQATAPTPEEIYQPAYIRDPKDAGKGASAQFRFEPFALGAEDSYAAGARLRFQGTSGTLYGEIGYRYSLVDGDSRHQVSEGYIHQRGRCGDLIAGRQHLFIYPANNTDIGTLLGLSTSDAIVYEAPLKRGFRQQVGYIFATRPLDQDRTFSAFGGNFAGGYARGQAPFWRGNVGYSLLASADEGRQLGWSLDASQAVIPNVLDVYGEGGVDVQDRQTFTAGLYIPALYHRARIDAFIEYSKREDTEEKFTLRVRRELGNNLLLVGFLDKPAGASVTGGGGLLWSIRFR